MKERIFQFLKEENKTSAQFADEIGVQPSGISHIISGRNNPSLEFVIKMLEKYKYLSTDWLLFGKGEMYNTKQNPSLFEENNLFSYAEGKQDKQLENLANKSTEIITNKKKTVSKIVWFYDDNTFKEFINESYANLLRAPNA